MTEVKTLIAALTTERNAIERAIVGLQQMSEIRNGARPKPAKPSRRARAKAARTKWTDDVKRACAERMLEVDRQGGTLSEAARALGREFSVPHLTINTSWRTWANAYALTTDNGAASQVQ